MLKGHREPGTPDLRDQKVYLNIMLGRTLITGLILDYYFNDHAVLVCNDVPTPEERSLLAARFNMTKIVPCNSGAYIIVW